jgi:hypothetical protein
MVVLFLHIKIMWIATVERSKRGNVDSSYCHPPTFPSPKYKKVPKIHFVHDNHSLFICHFSHDEEQEHTNLFEDMPSFEYLRLGERI